MSADPVRGRIKVEGNRGIPRIVENAPHTQLRDVERAPLLEEGRAGGLPKQGVLPWAPDAWYDEESMKVGYEISSNRYLYKPKSMRTLEEIRTVDQEAVGPVSEGLGTGDEQAGA